MNGRKYDLEERLINFAATAMEVAEKLPRTFGGNFFAGQLIRSASSPCLHYGEAQSAESRNDFIHKMKLSLKELREALNCLRLIKIKQWYQGELELLIDENIQLISIFSKSIDTAKKNNSTVVKEKGSRHPL